MIPVRQRRGRSYWHHRRGEKSKSGQFLQLITMQNAMPCSPKNNEFKAESTTGNNAGGRRNRVYRKPMPRAWN